MKYIRTALICSTLAVLAACGSVPQNPLADSGQITTNPTTGQASAAVQPTCGGTDPLSVLACQIGQTYGPDDANAINLSLGGTFNAATGLWTYPATMVDTVGNACFVDLAAVSNQLSAANGGAGPGTGGGVLTQLEQLRLMMLAFQGGGQANPLLMTALTDCIAMAQQTVAMGKALPLEFQNLMNQLLITAMQSPGGLPVPMLAKHPVKH